MRWVFFFLFLWISCLPVRAQELYGKLSKHALQDIELIGFDYYNTFELTKTKADSMGNFHLSLPKEYKGVTLLKTQDKENLVVIIDQPHIHIQGEHLSDKNGVVFTNSDTNTSFFRLANAYQSRAKVYKAWRYLKKNYSNSAELNSQVNTIKAIQDEIERIEKRNQAQLNEIASSYLQWYMPKRKLLSDISSIRDFPERVKALIQQFRVLNFTENHYKTSGLLKELIEAHYYLLENIGLSLEEMAVEMNHSTQKLISSTAKNPLILNTITKELFRYFEQHSLYASSSYLAQQLLSDKVLSTQIDESFQSQLQKYGALKVGNTATDFQLDKTTKLSDLKQNVLLVFDSDDMPQSIKELEELKSFYKDWKEKLEIVYVSSNAQKSNKDLYKQTSWKTISNEKGWATLVNHQYFIHKSRTYLLLDKEMKILEHPNSLGHINAWVKYKL